MRSIAYINEEQCIGCHRCYPVCPVDAIVGAFQYAHTVIAADCIGCSECYKACPVDCIATVNSDTAQPPADKLIAQHRRHRQRQQQLSPRLASDAKQAANIIASIISNDAS